MLAVAGAAVKTEDEWYIVREWGRCVCNIVGCVLDVCPYAHSYTHAHSIYIYIVLPSGRYLLNGGWNRERVHYQPSERSVGDYVSRADAEMPAHFKLFRGCVCVCVGVCAGVYASVCARVCAYEITHISICLRTPPGRKRVPMLLASLAVDEGLVRN